MWLNGAPLRVSSAASLIDSLLVTGFHYDVQKDPGEVIEVFGAFISRSRAVRRLGSAALDLCYVAAGRFDGFWERKLQPWDVAAGALIVAEAGGQVTAMSGDHVRLARGQYPCVEWTDSRPDAGDNCRHLILALGQISIFSISIENRDLTPRGVPSDTNK